jgi:hypothetical protein
VARRYREPPFGAEAYGVELNLNQIQGNVVPGFNEDHQAFMFVRFPGAAALRAWLAELVPEIASAGEVLASARDNIAAQLPAWLP